ncbi:conserved hypothetical protein [Ricinus communis]|uniref:T-complex protein 11 n=1 Tax=Ricinus communis TaxID=3988 RepID=B9S711_RICCO|nr:conserved hypothetical protein [Ricinus communis]|eukprot:XP_002521780.1 uncharacterized protein LOC8281373 isoform X2 [Ricinus communis]
MREQERISGGGAVLNFPADGEETMSSSSLSPPLKAPPRRLRRRLLAEPKTPLSAEDIEAKLREADLRRQAKRQRPEYLRQRRNMNNHLYANSKIIHKEEYLSRALARYWRRFVTLKKTTLSLAKAFLSIEINEESVKSMPFEQLALFLKSTTTLKTVKALVKRLESRLKLSQVVRRSQSSPANVNHLLRLLTSPHGKGNSSNTIERGAITIKSIEEEHQTMVKLSRYPVRVVLCAYMIMGHPNEVLSGWSECENTLAESAVNFIREFELLVKIIMHGPIKTSEEATTSAISNQKTFRSQLEAYDKAWCSYLHQFVAWKLKDAKLLEEDLVRASCQLELSMQTNKLTLGDDGGLTHDMEAIKKQVLDEQKLLRERVHHISGSAGLERLERALAEIRSKFIGGKKSESHPSKSSTAHASPSCPSGPVEGLSDPISVETSHLAKGFKGSGGKIHLFDHSLSEREIGFSSPKSITNNSQSFNPMLVSENELLVNEIVHGHRHGFADVLDAVDKDQSTVKAKVRETMEKAFWEGIMESIEQDEPDFSWILKLVKEVRDELCEMSPQNWREEIVKAIHVDRLSHVLKSGTLDMDYLGKSLEFALVTLQKLSAPANDEKMKSSHNKLLRELQEICKAGDKSSSSFSLLAIKGLRFVLQEIQALKREISKARIQFVEPFIKGSSGLEYLRKAFANRYGLPADSPSSLILTRQCLSSVLPIVEQEWNEYRDSLSVLASDVGSSQVLPKTLRTGGNIATISETGSPASGFDQLECKGERIDTLVRFILLKLVSGIGGLTLETLPETLKLNLSRLRVVQSQFQKIIVVSTSMLILRQMIVTEKLLSNSLDMENIVSESIEQLSELLDRVENVGLSEIAATISGTLNISGHVIDAEKLQARQKIMQSMLGKSLQTEDAVFVNVSRCVYRALRGAVLGGSGYKGRQLVVSALQKVGAMALADRIIEAAEVLIVMATISCSVHGAWYEELLKNI